MDQALLQELVLIKWLLAGLLFCALLSTLALVLFCRLNLQAQRRQQTSQLKQDFLNQAQEQLDKGHYDSLFDLAWLRVNEYPNDVSALWYLGQAQFKKRQYGLALKSFKKIQSIDPSYDKYAVEDFIDEIAEHLTGPTKLT